MPQELWADDSVVWSRDYSSPDSVDVTPATVTKLEEVTAMFNQLNFHAVLV
jgi:hypothetical protein